jgi:sec-independent protein translocase protein TatA
MAVGLARLARVNRNRRAVAPYRLIEIRREAEALRDGWRQGPWLGYSACLRSARAGTVEVRMRLGFGEILVVLVLALLFFGPSKLPQLGSSLGQALRGFKKGLSSLHDEIDVEATQEPPKSLPGEAGQRAGAQASSSTAADPKRT